MHLVAYSTGKSSFITDKRVNAKDLILKLQQGIKHSLQQVG